jgi:multimeric flavodoxin WrbA
MHIAVIHAGRKNGSTYSSVEIFKNELLKLGEFEFTEYILPKDMPHFCNGCFTCFFKGEDKCPHAQYVAPIAASLREADGIILSTPVYGCEVSGAMKALFDHLCYMWFPHRPMEEMFTKVGMVITTTAGAGAKTTIKTMKKNLSYWGAKRIYSYGAAVAASSFEDVKVAKKLKIHKGLKKAAHHFYRAVCSRKKLRPRVFTRFMFTLMKKMLSGYDDGNKDKEYWQAWGWLGGKTPFWLLR